MLESYKLNMICVAKTLEGLESILEKELQSLSVKRIISLKRAVQFETDVEGLYRCNYMLRTALNILVPIASDVCNSDNQLYAFSSKIKWDKYLDNNKTFAITNTVNSSVFTHSQYAALKLKDAIVDFFRRKYGTRPSIDRDYPDIKINLHIQNRDVSISLDSSGQPLFKRGYRKRTGVAPLNEVLAAGIIELAGWNADTDFIDPMCGSGTIPIEAFMKICKIPPGYNRMRFGFQDWADFEPSIWKKVKDEFNNKIIDPSHKIIGMDISPELVEDSDNNRTRVPKGELIQFKQKDFFGCKFDPGKTLIFNPPYNQRLVKKDINLFYKLMGDAMKNNAKDCTASIISGNPEALKHISLKPCKRVPLKNGPIDCKFHKFELYEGTRKIHKNQ